MNHPVALTTEFLVEGLRSMSLEEKWSLALKILTIFAGLFMTAVVSGIGYCIVQIHNLSVDLAKVPIQTAWFSNEVSDLKDEVKDMRRDLNLSIQKNSPKEK